MVSSTSAGEQPDRAERLVGAVRAEGHDRRGDDLPAARAALPGVDATTCSAGGSARPRGPARRREDATADAGPGARPREPMRAPLDPRLLGASARRAGRARARRRPRPPRDGPAPGPGDAVRARSWLRAFDGAPSAPLGAVGRCSRPSSVPAGVRRRGVRGDRAAGRGAGDVATCGSSWFAAAARRAARRRRRRGRGGGDRGGRRASTRSRRTSRRYLPQLVLAALVPVIVLRGRPSST